MQYAIIRTGGKQYKVKVDDVIEIDRLNSLSDIIIFNEVLLVSMDGKVIIGKPFISDMKVSAKVLADFKGEKIRVAKFKAKARYRRVIGFRPSLTRIQINSIGDSNLYLDKKEEINVDTIIKKTSIKKSILKKAIK
ncbi:hypothetical protein LBMAG33_2140 [Candidatus Levyibacteriota bacterium]|nr:50S ribosomal protein L21 [Candidatus Levybacteria bacterium]MSU25862.1 50S ribosomal protein L21 [Candidatus Levybacteria bacterium]GDX61904.1 hypothetical protein LBMAG33_2140 [Candidatus Levybacteria bacterium]